MTKPKEEIIRRGIFKVSNACAKKYFCEEGELTLTRSDLVINCKGHWSKTIPVLETQLEASESGLLVRNFWTGKALFTLTIDEPEQWEESCRTVASDILIAHEPWIDFDFEAKENAELARLLDIGVQDLEKLYRKVRKQRQFDIKNIRFNLDIEKILEHQKNRKLKAYLIVHCYVAWYEWTKKLLYEIYKAKRGKGPVNDEELMKFLNEYPHINFLSTTIWGIKANLIRNCVAHEKFYYDYKNSQIVFQINGKEKRLRLVEMKLKLFQLSSYYPEILKALREKIHTCGLEKNT